MDDSLSVEKLLTGLSVSKMVGNKLRTIHVLKGWCCDQNMWKKYEITVEFYNWILTENLQTRGVFAKLYNYLSKS